MIFCDAMVNFSQVAIAIALTLAGIALSGCAATRAGTDHGQRVAVPMLSEDELRPGADSLAVALTEALARAEQDTTQRMSPRLLDAYLTSAGEDGLDGPLVWEAYRSMLRNAETYRSDSSRAHMEQHIALAELLIPAHEQVGTTIAERAAQVMHWWIDADRTPAEDSHGRLVDHLRRVIMARDRYPAINSPTGLDARGETVVRFGEPSRKRVVHFNDSGLLRSFFRAGIQVRTTDFPDNEFWLYDRLGQGAIFLFVKLGRDGGFQKGTVNEMLPRQLRNRGVAGSARGGRYAMAALQSMRHILAQLALFHPTYGARYSAISDYVGWQEEGAISARLGGGGTSPAASYDVATRTLVNSLTRNQREDGRIEERREVTMPVEFAIPYRRPLPISTRAARFMDLEGRSEMRFYWEVDAGGDTYGCLIAGTDAHREERARLVSYQPESMTRTLMADTTYTPLSPATPGRLSVPIDGPVYQFALQVDSQPAATRNDAADRQQAQPCTGSARVNDIRPLDFGENGLAVSDLLPFRVQDVVETRADLAAGFETDTLAPFLRQSLAGEEALGLYFEVYTETDLHDDYILEYEVVRHLPGGILQRGRTQSTVYQARRLMVDQRLPAALLLDREEWRGADTVEVVVTVTNVVTGAESKRTVRFSVA